MYSCPHCSKNVKNLRKHIKRMHPDQVAKGEQPKAEPKTSVKTLELNVKPPEKKEPKKESEVQGYHCIDCGALITKGQNPCPNCGTYLDWSQA